MAVEFEDTFDGDELDTTRWLPWYLPHWSSRERSAARHEVGGGRLRLRIDRDQEPWCPEWDGDVRTSSLQTGAFCGPLGSEVGQLRFRPGLVVREEQEDARLYTPQYGRFEVRMKALADPAATRSSARRSHRRTRCSSCSTSTSSATAARRAAATRRCSRSTGSAATRSRRSERSSP